MIAYGSCHHYYNNTGCQKPDTGYVNCIPQIVLRMFLVAGAALGFTTANSEPASKSLSVDPLTSKGLASMVAEIWGPEALTWYEAMPSQLGAHHVR